MTDAEQLKQLLRKTDDDYLIGLSNKGTVKRAYKDLDGETPEVSWEGETAQVKLKDVVCKIRMPLGESSCSCPARTTCRHLIGAILWLKKECDEPAREEPEEEQREAEKPRFGQLLTMDPDKLRRICKSRRFRELLAYVEAGQSPPPEVSSVVTVSLPWEQVTVKLLEPVEYSSCSCHSQELCAHKAQAVLLYQLHENVVTLDGLRQLEASGDAWDQEEVGKTAAAIKEAVAMQLCTGLSRISPEMSESMNRMAVISHRAGLADFESCCREISAEYQLYFARAAAFRTSLLLKKLLRLYRMADQLEEASASDQGQAVISRLAGSFRDTYQPLPQLHLLGIGSRHFKSKTGYEGDIYYFLEPDQGSWYTWTDARPMFYEGQKRRYFGNAEGTSVPWGLDCSREQLTKIEFQLTGAKAAGGRRLSVSKETKSEMIGMRNLADAAVRKLIYQDYRQLLDALFSNGSSPNGTGERLALVAAAEVGQSSFDSIRQTFQMNLYDQEHRSLPMTVQYTNEEKLTIQILERLEKRLKNHHKKPPLFFGRLYLNEGQMHLYPIEFFEIEEAEEG